MFLSDNFLERSGPQPVSQGSVGGRIVRGLIGQVIVEQVGHCRSLIQTVAKSIARERPLALTGIGYCWTNRE